MPEKNFVSKPLSPELVTTFFDLQKEELRIRAEQLAVDAQHDENEKLIAEASIKANLTDRQSAREHVERKTKIILYGTIAIVLIVLVFCGYALHVGRGEIVYKITEIIAVFSAGFAGGYGVRASKTSQQMLKE